MPAPTSHLRSHPRAAPHSELSGHGWGYGFTAGVTVDADTDHHHRARLSFGAQSEAQRLDVNYGLPNRRCRHHAGFARWSSASGLRQHRSVPQWTLLGTVEWTNWSRIGTSVVLQPMVSRDPGGSDAALPFQYEDGWFFSVGAEYQWTQQLARARRHRLRNVASHRSTCARRCCRTTTATGCRLVATYN